MKTWETEKYSLQVYQLDRGLNAGKWVASRRDKITGAVDYLRAGRWTLGSACSKFKTLEAAENAARKYQDRERGGKF